MATRNRIKRRPARSQNPPSTPDLPADLRPIIELAYSSIAVCIFLLESQAADRDVDAARVLRHGALLPLADLAWPLDGEMKGGEA